MLQSPTFDVCLGGAEANVAVALARLNNDARMVSVLPDNVLGRRARDELRRHGVDVTQVQFGPGRMGLYFLTNGALLRPSEVLYDRAYSAFTEAADCSIDWALSLKGAERLHLSGVTAALGASSAKAALRAAEAAKNAGVPVSFDGNYRAKLWESWNGNSGEILRSMLALSDIAFADERDIGLVLQCEFPGSREDRFQEAADAAFAEFPNLQVITCTQRVQHSVDHHDLSAVLITRDSKLQAKQYELRCVVDRVGAGDAFVAGMLHLLARGASHRDALDFALASAVLKHSIPGDLNLVEEADIHALLSEEGLHVRR